MIVKLSMLCAVAAVFAYVAYLFHLGVVLR